MNPNEKAEIERHQATGEASFIRCDFPLSPRLILAFTYTRCTDIRGSLKILHAIRYLTDPGLYEVQECWRRKYARRS